MTDRTWNNYEEVAQHLVAQYRDGFGLASVEGKQKLLGAESGTEWEVDAKGVREKDGATVIVECRQYRSHRDNQKALAALAWQIRDVGAGGAIHVSPLGLQEGARRVAEAAGVIEVRLNADATPLEFQMRFLNQIVMGLHEEVRFHVQEHVEIEVRRDGVLIHRKVL